MSQQHPGFKKVGSEIAQKEGVPLDEAYAMLAKSTRNASPEARAKNKRLNRVKGK